MTQTIAAVHTALAALFDDLSIADPVTMAIGHVYPYPPPIAEVIEAPAIVIGHSLTEARFMPGGMVQQDYEMSVQIYAADADADADMGANIANAFLDEIVSALSAHVTLSGEVQVVKALRGGSGGTLVSLVRGKMAYVGLDLVIPINITDTRTRGA